MQRTSIISWIRRRSETVCHEIDIIFTGRGSWKDRLEIRLNILKLSPGLNCLYKASR